MTLSIFQAVHPAGVKPLILAALLTTTMLFPPHALAQDAKAGMEVAEQKTAEAAILTLDQAIASALANSPVLAASSSRADAATESRAQAGAFPNPEISIEAENIYGDGPYKGLDSAEMTYGVSQLVELPGKRSSRIRVAESEKTKIDYLRDGARLDLIENVTVAYAEAVASLQDLTIMEKERELAAAVLDSVAAKVEAGREPPIQKNKAEIELSTREIALDRARRAVDTKKQALATMIGTDISGLVLSFDSLPALSEPAPLDTYQSRLPRTPDIQRYEADVHQAQSALSLEKANAFPDPTVGIGVRKFREDDRQALVAGVSFPLPVFNLNRASIKRAGHELNAAKMEQRGGFLSQDLALRQAYEDLTSAYREAMALHSDIVPGAEKAFEFARGGYDAGKFNYLEVLDAQRTLFETRKQHNQSVLEYYRQRAVIERLTAIHGDVPHQNNPKIEKE